MNLGQPYIRETVLLKQHLVIEAISIPDQMFIFNGMHKTEGTMGKVHPSGIIDG